MDCQFPGCPNRVLRELQEIGLCLEHYIQNIQLDANTLALGLEDPSSPTGLRPRIDSFVCTSAAKLTTVGVNNPRLSDFDRARLLNAMFMLIELRERSEKLS